MNLPLFVTSTHGPVFRFVRKRQDERKRSSSTITFLSQKQQCGDQLDEEWE
jgi:hypothetical protein